MTFAKIPQSIIPEKKEEHIKGPFLYYIRVKGWVGGIAEYLLFLTGKVGGFGSSVRKKQGEVTLV